MKSTHSLFLLLKYLRQIWTRSCRPKAHSGLHSWNPKVCIHVDFSEQVSVFVWHFVRGGCWWGRAACKQKSHRHKRMPGILISHFPIWHKMAAAVLPPQTFRKERGPGGNVRSPTDTQTFVTRLTGCSFFSRWGVRKAGEKQSCLPSVYVTISGVSHWSISRTWVNTQLCFCAPTKWGHPPHRQEQWRPSRLNWSCRFTPLQIGIRKPQRRVPNLLRRGPDDRHEEKGGGCC